LAVKRWVLRILVCLILGAITTVAVAWGIASRTSFDLLKAAPANSKIFAKTLNNGRYWSGYAMGTPGALRMWSFVEVRPEWYGIMREHLGEWPLYEMPSWGRAASCMMVAAPDHCCGFLSAYGWPNVALVAAFHDHEDSGLYSPKELKVVGTSAVVIGLPDGAALGPPHALPLRPIWPGFVIDTLFYAAIWGGSFFGFASAKRAIRRARGRCPMCGYDLRGGVISDQRLAIRGKEAVATAGCPECGWGRQEAAT
jgi:hypothetical protein